MRPDPGAGASSCTGTGARAGHAKSRALSRTPVTSSRAVGLTAASTTVAAPSSKSTSRTDILISGDDAEGAGGDAGGVSAGGAEDGGVDGSGAGGVPAGGARRSGVRIPVIGMEPSGRRSSKTHDLRMWTRSMVAVAGQA